MPMNFGLFGENSLRIAIFTKKMGCKPGLALSLRRIRRLGEYPRTVLLSVVSGRV